MNDTKKLAANVPRINFDSEDGIMHIQLQVKNVRQRIAYLKQKLNLGHSATLQAFGLAVSSAV
jgi:hypothetical protein